MKLSILIFYFSLIFILKVHSTENDSWMDKCPGPGCPTDRPLPFKATNSDKKESNSSSIGKCPGPDCPADQSARDYAIKQRLIDTSGNTDLSQNTSNFPESDQIGFCEPSIDKSTCTTQDGLVYRLDISSNQLERYIIKDSNGQKENFRDKNQSRAR